MQGKRIVLGLWLSLSLGTVWAQDMGQVRMNSPFRVVQRDTIVLSADEPRPQGAPIADRKLPTPQPRFKPVPLMVSKTYYGPQHEFVNEFVRKYFLTNHRSLDIIKGRSESVFPLIDDILAEYEIPRELKYLAVIESALKNTARSRVGAVGPWQFMAPTARLMGLKVGKGKDERTDWTKATTAAAKYLTWLYGELDDWLLVVAAYNCGPSPVQRAIKRTGSTNFWDIKPYLPRETQGHVLAFIATASIFEHMNGFIGQKEIPGYWEPGMPIPNPEQEQRAQQAQLTAADSVIAASPFTREELENMAIVRLSSPLHPEYMIAELGMEAELFSKWNPDYRDFEFNTYQGDYYSLRIPKDKLQTFIQKKEVLTKRSMQYYRSQM